MATEQRENTRKVVTIALNTVEREEVSWFWPGRMPFGKFTIVEGSPGRGKSWLTLAS